MSRKPGRAAQFWLSFVLGVLVLAAPFSLALVNYAGSKSGAPGQSDAQSSYYPQRSDAITLTVGLRTQAKQPPHAVLLLRIDPTENALTFAVLPPETMVEDASRLDAVSLVWKREGGKRAETALETALEIYSDRWLELTDEGLESIGEVMGAVDMTLTEAVRMENGMEAIARGRQLIDGRRAAMLLDYRGYAGGEQQRLEMVAQLAQETMRQRVGMLSEGLLLEVFERAVNSGASNLAVGDFESRRRALTHMISRNPTVRQVTVVGDYNEAGNTFLPTVETLARLQGAFGQSGAQTA